MAHTANVFVTFFYVRDLLLILFVQLFTGYSIFHTSQNSSHVSRMNLLEVQPVSLTAKVPTDHLRMLLSSTSVESEFDLGTCTKTTMMPWTSKSSAKEDLGICTISHQSQQSDVINALPEVGQSTESGQRPEEVALTKSESEDKAKSVKIMFEAQPKAPSYKRHQEERKKRKYKRTLDKNRQPSQQAIEQAETVKVKLETRLKQANHELTQSLNQCDICKFSTELHPATVILFCVFCVLQKAY